MTTGRILHLEVRRPYVLDAEFDDGAMLCMTGTANRAVRDQRYRAIS